MNNTSTVCCPPFDPTPWRNQEVVWNEKPFIIGRVLCLFHMPLNFGSVCTKLSAAATAADSLDTAGPWLSDETSAWHSDLMIPVTYPVPGQQNITLTGRFKTFVFEGPYRDAPKWYASVKEQLAQQTLTAKRMLVSYTTCPKCAKKYGKNYVVFFAQIG